MDSVKCEKCVDSVKCEKCVDSVILQGSCFTLTTDTCRKLVVNNVAVSLQCSY